MNTNNKKQCLRCSGDMISFGQWSNFMNQALDVQIYICKQCGKLEIFNLHVDDPELDIFDTDSFIPPINNSGFNPNIDNIEQKLCPSCGKLHDIDYPKCPYCEYKGY